MRRLALALSGLCTIGALGLPTNAGAAPKAQTVRTVAGGWAGLSAPSGVALDAAGNLFIADTDHCRVLMVPAHRGLLYGSRVSAHHIFTLAGGTCTRAGLGHPTGVAVDHHGDVFIAVATGDRVLVVPPGGQDGPHAPEVVAGTGHAGYNGSGRLATATELNEPTGVAVDAADDLFIADTANCRVREVPATSGKHFGLAMTAGHLYELAGNGVCGSADRPGPARLAELSNPVAVAVDQFDDLYIADNGDQSVLEAPVHGGYYYDTIIGGGDIGTIVGTGGNGSYLEDGLSATGVAAELNDPEGLAVDAAGTLFITDGRMHSIRVVPRTTSTVLGRALTGSDYYTLAGALPVTSASGAGNGTRWILTHVDDPTGIALAASGSVVFSDRSTNLVREIR